MLMHPTRAIDKVVSNHTMTANNNIINMHNNTFLHRLFMRVLVRFALFQYQYDYTNSKIKLSTIWLACVGECCVYYCICIVWSLMRAMRSFNLYAHFGGNSEPDAMKFIDFLWIQNNFEQTLNDNSAKMAHFWIWSRFCEYTVYFREKFQNNIENVN